MIWELVGSKKEKKESLQGAKSTSFLFYSLILIYSVGEHHYFFLMLLVGDRYYSLALFYSRKKA